MEAAQEQGFKYAVISQSANEQWWPNDSAAERLAAGYEAACAAFFVSEANLALSRRQFVTPLTRGRVIRNPFNVRYDARPAWPGDPSESLFLACVARLDPFQKGQDLLLEVLDQPRWRGRKVHVTFVGTGQNERVLRKTAMELKLAKYRIRRFCRGYRAALDAASRSRASFTIRGDASLLGRSNALRSSRHCDGRGRKSRARSR